MFDRPQWRFKFNDKTYEYRGYVGAPDAILLHKHTGLGVLGFLNGLATAGAANADPSCLVGMVFLAKRHAGEDVLWTDLVESMVGEADLLALVQSITDITGEDSRAEKPASGEAQPEPEPTVEKPTKVRKTPAAA